MVRLDISTVKVGDEIRIPAWWMNEEPTLCKVEQVWIAKEHGLNEVWSSLTVRPLVGNPHARMITVYPVEKD